jgi:hypothetical protein
MNKLGIVVILIFGVKWGYSAQLRIDAVPSSSQQPQNQSKPQQPQPTDEQPSDQSMSSQSNETSSSPQPSKNTDLLFRFNNLNVGRESPLGKRNFGLQSIIALANNLPLAQLQQLQGVRGAPPTSNVQIDQRSLDQIGNYLMQLIDALTQLLQGKPQGEQTPQFSQEPLVPQEPTQSPQQPLVPPEPTQPPLEPIVPQEPTQPEERQSVIYY